MWTDGELLVVSGCSEVRDRSVLKLHEKTMDTVDSSSSLPGRSPLSLQPSPTSSVRLPSTSVPQPVCLPAYLITANFSYENILGCRPCALLLSITWARCGGMNLSGVQNSGVWEQVSMQQSPGMRSHRGSMWWSYCEADSFSLLHALCKRLVRFCLQFQWRWLCWHIQLCRFLIKMLRIMPGLGTWTADPQLVPHVPCTCRIDQARWTIWLGLY